MEEITEKIGEKTKTQNESGNTAAFKPSINIRRRQTRKLVAQVDEEIADMADEYVEFATECFGYPVSHGEILNEVYKSLFARDSGFKGWRAKRNERKNSAI